MTVACEIEKEQIIAVHPTFSFNIKIKYNIYNNMYTYALLIY